MLAFSASFEYLCYGSRAIRNILILSVRGPTLLSDSDVYIKTVPALKGLINKLYLQLSWHGPIKLQSI